MPQEEEAPQDETKVEDTDSTLDSDVNNGQSDPVHVLKYKNLEEVQPSDIPHEVRSSCFAAASSSAGIDRYI